LGCDFGLAEIMKARLIFLGHGTVDENSDLARGGEAGRLVEPRNLTVDAPISLEIKHVSRWHRRDVTRVIVGSDPKRADVLLVDEPLTVSGEHARFYLNHDDLALSELRPMRGSPVSVNGQRLRDFQWTKLRHGDEIQLGQWRFRFET
jgi:hypothetical protein